MLAKALVVLIPFLFLGIWYVFGREKKFTVPQYLSVVPNEKHEAVGGQPALQGPR